MRYRKRATSQRNLAEVGMCRKKIFERIIAISPDIYRSRICRQYILLYLTLLNLRHEYQIYLLISVE